MESIRNNESDPMESYRRLVKNMDEAELEKEFDDLQEAFAALSHSPVFSNSFIDLTDLKTFTDEVNPRLKTAEVEQKMKVIEKELELRGLEEVA